MSYSKVPNQIKEIPNWLIWMYFRKADGKQAKIPLDPKTGGFASVSDPATWGDYPTAVERAQQDPRANGIGFVFTSRDPLAGVDFDHCRNPETGEIDPLVLAQIAMLDSYTEISVSGTGIHVIVQAALSGQGCRRNQVEFYDRGRFFIVTGNHLAGFPLEINERQAELDALHQQIFPPKTARPPSTRRVQNRNVSDETLVARIMRSRQAEKFECLLDGLWSEYSSQSEADLALCGVLSFWTQDSAQIDRIFRSSALYRPKWDESHSQSGLTYGEMTIQKALSDLR